MIRTKHFGLLALAASAILLTAANASAQTADCLDSFVAPSEAKDLCLDADLDILDALDHDDLVRALVNAADTCEEGDEVCASCTLSEAWETEAGCAYCYVQAHACLNAHCSQQCGDDLELALSEECADCIEAAECDAEFSVCEGVGEDDTSTGNDNNDDNENGGDDGNNESGEVDDPYGKTCSGGPDCKDGEWDVSQTGGRIGSSCATNLSGAGGGLTALLLGLGLMLQRRRRK